MAVPDVLAERLLVGPDAVCCAIASIGMSPFAIFYNGKDGSREKSRQGTLWRPESADRLCGLRLAAGACRRALLVAVRALGRVGVRADRLTAGLSWSFFAAQRDTLRLIQGSTGKRMQQKQLGRKDSTLRITVLGCGRFASFLAWYFACRGDSVLMYGRETSLRRRELEETRKNQYLTLPDSVGITFVLDQALAFSDMILVSIAAQGVKDLFGQIAALGTSVSGKVFVLCMKGLIEEDGERLSEAVQDALGDSARVAAWVGPGHPEDFVQGVPNCMVIASADRALADRLSKAFSTKLIRIYASDDLIGNEIGAAAKNVIGLAAGMLDGLSLSALKGALMARGAKEVARLIGAMGGNETTAYGLCHLGDYEATLFSQYSHNRRFGQAFVLGEPYGELAEGVSTSKALMCLADRHGVELPISSAVYRILYEGKTAKQELKDLFLRKLKEENG